MHLHSDSGGTDPSLLQVTVAHSPAPGAAAERTLLLRQGSTLAEALAASGVLAAWPPEVAATLRTGIWGALRPRDTLLTEGDRVEVYRPLLADPKDARRLRARQQRRKRA